MKKFFLVVMTMAIGSVALATGNDPSPTGMAVVRTGSTFRVFYKAPGQTNVTVSIYDESNNKVFSESFKESEGFIRPYNFEKLKEGKYTIELKDAAGFQIEKIAYEKKIEEKIARMVKLPGEEKYAILVPTNGSKSLSVDIYNRYGSSVYSKAYEVNGDFSRLFDLTVLDSFTVVVSDSKGLTTTLYK
jgi:hypothetical protein